MDDHRHSPEPDRQLTRRELLEGSLAAGAVLALPGILADSAEAAIRAAGPKKGGAVRIGMSDGGPSETLNPYRAPLHTEGLRATLTHDSLFTRLLGNVPTPQLAVSVEPGRSAKEWKVTLRPDVVFHNGKPLTADDVIWSFRYVLNAKNKADGRESVEPVDPRGLKKLSKREILFRLNRPIGDFGGSIATRVQIVPEGTTRFDTIVGTGPFKLDSWSAGRRTVLVRNDHYFANVWLDRVTMVPIPDPGQRINALLTGQIDAAWGIDFTAAEAYRANAKVNLIVSTSDAIFVPFYVRTDVSPFDDRRVVEALKLSVDRNEMLRNVLVGFGTIGNDVQGKGFPSYNDKLPQHKYDPERARFLLKQAGREDLTFTLFTSTSWAGMLESATAWKEQVKPAGITIDLQKIPADSYFSNDKYLKVPAYQSIWPGSFESIAPSALFSGATYNETHWNRPQWEAEFRKAQAITDDKKRNAAYKKLQEPVWAESGYIIWGFQAQINALSKSIRGARPLPVYNMRPEQWWMA